MTQPIETLMDRYSDAWNRHDVEGILALHTEDSVFENHTSGGKAVGHEKIRALLAGVFQTFPDLRFEARRRYIANDVAVVEWTARATFARPVECGGRTYPPSGKELAWNGLDVIPVRDGFVARKDVYADSISFMRQIGAL